ncbi:YhjD/YihY/BrkB family envelope integrity protein [Streptomyces puniciscabiei]|uniref:YhjD/YihY/BrkB family envelope integrity protein n=1 Tax=Streptomyces puniciscabiei TaxID=164348 RepID=UPI0033267047
MCRSALRSSPREDTPRRPVLAAVAGALVLVPYRSGPSCSRPVRKTAPGGGPAILLLLIVSSGFTVYASHVSTYYRLYGSLAGVVVFLVWLWPSDMTQSEPSEPRRGAGRRRPLEHRRGTRRAA